MIGFYTRGCVCWLQASGDVVEVEPLPSMPWTVIDTLAGKADHFAHKAANATWILEKPEVSSYNYIPG
jgi:hypothetical protein